VEQFHFDGTYDKRIKVIRDKHREVLLIEGRPYMRWVSDDELTKRIAMAQLYELKMGSQEQIATAFGVSTKSVYNYAQVFGQKGSSGLVSGKRGPKGSWKISREVRSKILYIFLKEGIVEYERIKQRLEEWGEDIGTASIRRVLMANGLVTEVSVFTDLTDQRGLFDIQDYDEQLYFDYGEDKGIDQMGGAAAYKGNGHKTIPPQRKAPVFLENERKAKRHYSPNQRIYLDQLEQGSYSTYAGGLLYTPFLSQYPFLSPLESVIPIPAYEGYSLAELCQTLFYFDIFGFRSMEDFKRVYPEEFGILIGRTSSPSHYTLRRFLHRVRKLCGSEELMEEYAHMYLRTGLAKWGVLYIDAHFLPYYGMYPITKGWHGVRQIAMKGSYHFLGIDEHFVPWIFFIRSSSEGLLDKIPEMVGKAKEVARSEGVAEEDTDKLVVIFDREGFSGELYNHLDGRDREGQRRRALFISWAKYAYRWVYKIPEERFEKRAVVKYEIQGPREERYFETERRMSKYGKIRAVVVERQTDQKRMAIYTNGSVDEISSEKVVELICRRWGQENLIKELLMKHFINYSPGYVKENMEEQPLVDNPRMKQLKKEKGKLTGELNKFKIELAEKILKEADDETKWEQIKKRDIQILAEIVGRENEMLFLDQELEKLPRKMPYDQAHQGRRLLKFNYEKKRFLDSIKLYTYNAKKKMCQLLLNYYDKEKEILPALAMIVGRGGYVKLQGGRLRVQLRGFKNSEINYAARHLCKDLNSMDPRTLDKFRIPIYFEVA